MSLDDMKKILKEYGIVGAGGAGFPSYAKLSYEVDTVILNAAECEPLFKVDQNLLIEETNKVLKGLEYVVEGIGAKKGIVAIKEHYHEACIEIDKNIINYVRLNKVLIEDGYPAGDEVVLVYEVTGLVVPQGGIPINVGVMVINVETALNIYNAIEKKKPVIHKYLTIGGEVKIPKTLKVPIGIKIKDLLDEVGGITIENYKVLIGGPLTGRIGNLNEVVTKTTKGIFILKVDNPVVELREYNLKIALKRAMGICSQCRMCTDLCPRNLLGHNIEPHKIMNTLAFGLDYNIDSLKNALACCECNLCSTYACHQNLNPMGIIKDLKTRLREKGIKLDNSISISKVKDEREYRRVPVKRVLNRLGLNKYNVNTVLTNSKTIPNYIELYLKQGIGVKCKAIVKEGEIVVEGQVVGVVEEKELGVFLHSSINGKVYEVTSNSIIIKREE